MVLVAPINDHHRGVGCEIFQRTQCLRLPLRAEQVPVPNRLPPAVRFSATIDEQVCHIELLIVLLESLWLPSEAAEQVVCLFHPEQATL